MQANVTDARGIARMGFCLPIECTQDDLDIFQKHANAFTNFGISLLPKLGIYIDNLVFTPTSQAAMDIKDSDTYADDWH